MKMDQRFWRTLHVLIHMSHHKTPMTSHEIAKMLNTNPVVVRCTLSGLRDHISNLKKGTEGVGA